MRHALYYLMIYIATLGCGRAASQSARSRACDGIVLAAATAKQFLDVATTQRASSERAMDRDGDARARSYRDVATALCQSANTSLWQMRELIRIAKDEELTRASHRLAAIDCAAGYIDGIASDAAKRREAMIGWQDRRGATINAVNEVASLCFDAAADVPSPPPIALPTE
jgi:hypothetical protein